MAEPRSITQVGTSEPFELQVSRGHVAWHTPFFKFGFNPDVSDSEETIWGGGGLYPYLSAATNALSATFEGVLIDSRT